MKIVNIWILPLIISLGLFIVLRPTFAQIAEGQLTLADYLKSASLEVGSENVEGYTQVYYVFEGQKVFITEGSVNSNMPVTESERIVYRQSLPGGDQLFVYNIISGQTIQITNSGNNTNPKIKGKYIIWEGQVDGNWQIFLFDGLRIRQLTYGDLSINPEIEGDFIIYARKDITGTWRSELYSISKGETRDVTIGISSKHPTIRNGRIYLGSSGSQEEFTLTADDIFLLNLTSLTATNAAETFLQNPDEPQVVGVEEIVSELEATSSALISQ